MGIYIPVCDNLKWHVHVPVYSVSYIHSKCISFILLTKQPKFKFYAPEWSPYLQKDIVFI